MSGRLLSKIVSHCTKQWIFRFRRPGFSFLFFGSSDESLSRWMVSGYHEPRTAQCSARVSPFFQPRGRWARSGKKASGCQLSAGDGGVASRVDEREQFACEVLEQQRAPGGRWQSSGSLQLAGAGGGALRAGAFLAVPIDLADRKHVAGCAGRQGVEQPAPGGWRAFRPLPGALRQVRRQVRKFRRCAIENLSTLSSSLVPHSRLFSLHP